MAATGIPFTNLQLNHYYTLSQNPQTISTALGLSNAMIQNLWQLKDNPHQLTQINCSNTMCTATFQRPQANMNGSTSFTVDSRHLLNGTNTRFTEIYSLPPGAGASGGAKQNRLKFKTRKTKKSRKLRKIKK